jgi:hypothetical protein
MEDYMSVGKKSSWEYLDGETCFNLWAQTGSLAKAVRILIDNGIVNKQKGGNAPTEAGVRIAARRWMARNPAEARLRMKALGEDWVDDDQEWKSWLVFQAKDALGAREYEAFITENHFEEYATV